MCSQFELCPFMFSFVRLSKLIIFYIILLYCSILIFFQFHILNPWCMFLSNQLIVLFYHHLNLKVTLLISSLKTLCFLLLNICCVFYINFFFFNEFFMSFSKTFALNLIFLVSLFYFQVGLLINNFFLFLILNFLSIASFFVSFARLSSSLLSVK